MGVSGSAERPRTPASGARFCPPPLGHFLVPGHQRAIACRTRTLPAWHAAHDRHRAADNPQAVAGGGHQGAFAAAAPPGPGRTGQRPGARDQRSGARAEKVPVHVALENARRPNARQPLQGAGRLVRAIRQPHAAGHHPGHVSDARRTQRRPEAGVLQHYERGRQHAGRMRRHQPQRGSDAGAHSHAHLRARALHGADAGRVAGAAIGRVRGDMAGWREGGQHGVLATRTGSGADTAVARARQRTRAGVPGQGGADLRRDVHATQVQDRCRPGGGHRQQGQPARIRRAGGWRHGPHPQQGEHVCSSGGPAWFHPHRVVGGLHQGDCGCAARSRRPGGARACPPQVFGAQNGHRCVPQAGTVVHGGRRCGAAAMAAAAQMGVSRLVRLARGRRRTFLSRSEHRERPHPGRLEDGAAARGGRVRLSDGGHAAPEYRCGDRYQPDRSAAAHLDGVPGTAVVRAGHHRGRARHALVRVAGARFAGQGRPAAQHLHGDAYDRLSERLLAAVHGRAGAGRQRTERNVPAMAGRLAEPDPPRVPVRGPHRGQSFGCGAGVGLLHVPRATPQLSRAVDALGPQCRRRKRYQQCATERTGASADHGVARPVHQTQVRRRRAQRARQCAGECGAGGLFQVPGDGAYHAEYQRRAGTAFSGAVNAGSQLLRWTSVGGVSRLETRHPAGCVKCPSCFRSPHTPRVTDVAAAPSSIDFPTHSYLSLLPGRVTFAPVHRGEGQSAVLLTAEREARVVRLLVSVVEAVVTRERGFENLSERGPRLFTRTRVQLVRGGGRSGDNLFAMEHGGDAGAEHPDSVPYLLCELRHLIAYVEDKPALHDGSASFMRDYLRTLLARTQPRNGWDEWALAGGAGHGLMAGTAALGLDGRPGSAAATAATAHLEIESVDAADDLVLVEPMDAR
eukprot:ctg_445.g233